MFLKKFLTSVCIVSFLCFCTVPKANAVGVHFTIDQPANSLLAQILSLQISDVAVKLADLNTFIDLITSMGDPEQLLSGLDLNKALGASVANIGDFSGIAGGLSGITGSLGGVSGLANGDISGIAGMVGADAGSLATMGSVVGTATKVIKGDGINTSDVLSTAGTAVGAAGAALGEGWDAVGQAGAALSTAGAAYDMVEKQGENLIGEAKGAVSTAKKGIKSVATKVIGNISVPAELQEIGFTKAITDSKEMTTLIEKELLPPIEGSTIAGKALTDEDKVERQQRRIALRDAAVADAYALAVAMQHEGSSVQEGSIASAKSRVDSSETLQERAAASLDVGLARVSQLVRGNEISAMSLRLLAAEAIASMPRDYGF